MLLFIALVAAFIIYLILRSVKKERINRVEEMQRKHISFNSKFGHIVNVGTLSWERLKEIAETPEEELRRCDKAIWAAREEERKKQREIDEQYERIVKEYPHGVYAYKMSHPSASKNDYIRDEREIEQHNDRIKKTQEEKKRIEQEKAKDLEELFSSCPSGVALFKKHNPQATQNDFIRKKQLIKDYEAYANKSKHYKTWAKHQESFASESRALCPKGWGCYYYDINIEGIDEYGKGKFYPFRIWQHFSRAYCRDTSLDYTHFPITKKNCENLDGCRLKKLVLLNPIYDTILSIIRRLSGNVMVLFSGSGNNPNTIPYTDSLNAYHFKYLREELFNDKIPYWEIDYDSYSVEEGQNIVIVEFDSTNTRLVDNCIDIFNKFRDKRPCITYISVFKEHSFEEMSGIITEYNNRIKEEEEKKSQEIERQKRVTDSLKSAVSTWGKVPYSWIPHEYIFRYYPTTCDFDATDEEWYVRNLIWSFKNDPNKRTQILHEEALEETVDLIEERLKNTFGDYISKLTLVCIPASSPAKNKARYEEFSSVLCQATGMSNAYSHLSVNGERIARHEGGEAGEVDSISFDEEYYKGKNILLFDDLLTRGDSMRKFGQRLTSLGANVIAGITLGKTFHTREEDNSHPSPSLYQYDGQDEEDDDYDYDD